MSEILGIYILDENWKTAYMQEFFSFQNSGDVDNALLSNFVTALHMFAAEIGTGQLNSIELGESIIYSSNDSISNLKFIIRCDKNGKKKKMEKILTQIKNSYLNLFTGYLHLDDDKRKKELNIKFSDEVDGILGSKNAMSDFLSRI